ncbi:MAG: hypothetical protein H7061_00090 [Bdellovibrionaceae bacterium]|nr:hypothetical protein [Bdellovibrio sp.]
MATNNTTTGQAINYMNVEEAAHNAFSVHWRAIFAGLFIAMLVFFTLISMGVGIGAGQAIDVLRGEDSAGALGAVGGGVSSLASTVGGGALNAAQSAANNPQIAGVVEDALGDLNLKSYPETVATGFLSRLARGNDEAAANYLAAQTAGWITFALLALGTISAMLGGAFGAQLNLRPPVDTADRKASQANPS